MEYDKIKQLIEDMGNSKITSLDIEFPDGMKVKMEKSTEKVVTTEKIEAPREYVEVVKTEEEIEKAENHQINEYLVIRAGRANPHILDKVFIDYYGDDSFMVDLPPQSGTI